MAPKRLPNDSALLWFARMKTSVLGLFKAATGLLGILLGLFAGAVQAERSPVAFESTYLGDGWFEYSVVTTDDPFFLFLDIMGTGVQFGPSMDAGPAPAQWTNLVHTNFISWSFDGIGLGDQTRPYRATFRLRSAHTNYRRAPGAGLVLMSLAIVGGYHGQLASANIVGYWIPDALVPCAPEEADGSATNLVLWAPMISGLPEPRLVNLIQDGGEQVGVNFEYPEPSTVRLEGTRDFRSWNNVAYIHGNAGVTAWTTNVSLSSYGDFFRLRLVAEGHATNMPPLSEASPLLVQSKTKREFLPKLSGVPIAGEINVTIANVSGGTCAITELGSNLQRSGASPVKLGGKAIPIRWPTETRSFGFYEIGPAR